jgi:hypothetical protein
VCALDVRARRRIVSPRVTRCECATRDRFAATSRISQSNAAEHELT